MKKHTPIHNGLLLIKRRYHVFLQNNNFCQLAFLTDKESNQRLRVSIIQLLRHLSAFPPFMCFY